MLRIDESWTAGDKIILTTAGESESLTAAGDCKNLLIVENEKSWDHCWGPRSLGCMPIYWGFKDESLHSVKGQKLGAYQSSEVSRMRIFILLTINCYLVDLQAFTETCIVIWS